MTNYTVQGGQSLAAPLFGRPAYVRVTTRRPGENIRLLEAIQEMV